MNHKFKLLVKILPIAILTAVFVVHPVSAVEGINPLRLGRDQKSWQLTLNASRYLNKFTVNKKKASGLWKEQRTVNGTLYSLETSLDLNESIGFMGSFSYDSTTTRVQKLNLWTGKARTKEESGGEFGSAALKMKLDIWENSELRSYFSIPLLGGPGAAGLVWSRDPIMVFPKFVTDGSMFGLNTGVSFVANSKFAFNGNISLSHEDESSRDGFSGGLIYRDGQYDGVQLSVSIEKGASVRASVELGLSYGEEK